LISRFLNGRGVRTETTRKIKMQIKSFVLLGVMIAVTIIYLFAGDFKGCTGPRIGDQPNRAFKTVAPER
jgi:hypothetical protein